MCYYSILFHLTLVNRNISIYIYLLQIYPIPNDLDSVFKGNYWPLQRSSGDSGQLTDRQSRDMRGGDLIG